MLGLPLPAEFRDWTTLATAIAAVGTLLVMMRRAPFEIRKAQGDTFAQLTAQLRDMRKDLLASQEAEDLCRARLDEKDNEVEALKNRLRVVESAIPAAIITAKLQRMTPTTLDTFDFLREGFVLSSPSEGGKHVYVNTAMANALGMTPAEFIAKPWRELVHPDDLARAEGAEGEAWGQGGKVTLRYRHKDGHYVKTLWHFSDYEDGAAFSVVYFERRRESTTAFENVPPVDN
jgi:PAS domain S-box-containing protein